MKLVTNPADPGADQVLAPELQELLALNLTAQMLSSLSHELRTPTSVIQGWAQVLRREGRSHTRLQRGLLAIERNARIQAGLIDDLLDLASLSSGQVQLQLRPLSALALADTALLQMQSAASAAGIKLGRRTTAGTPQVRGDAERLGQLLCKLLSNAIKFSSTGTDVWLAVSHDAHNVYLRVSDHGVGIAPRLLESIFVPFRPPEPGLPRQHGGLGVGLAIARKLAELHGGSLHADSAGLGQGACFTLCLPVVTRPAAS
ncbi:MAG: HAMP domain-containing histidine kinase [Burkholderiaceae bacterium]|nr:HAMP domain-containing histidine kinase [Burkholderiaceae bacterium]